jgi:TolA-binding protein
MGAVMAYFRQTDSGYCSPEPAYDPELGNRFEDSEGDLRIVQRRQNELRQRYLQQYLDQLNKQYDKYILSLSEIEKQNSKKKQQQKRFKKIKKTNRRQAKLNSQACRKN